MKKGAGRRRRHAVLSGAWSLEDRVLMATIGRATLTPPAEQGASVSPISRVMVHVVPTQAQRAAQFVSHPAGHSLDSAVAPTAQRWSWLANTFWYVPATNLAAVLYNSSTGSLTPVKDQTVYHITGHGAGYFWGNAVTQLGSSSASDSTMVGSVTPEGQVILTFTKTNTNSSPSITEGFGKMQRKFGQWTMENQMFTSPNEVLQIGHWAYMLRTRPGMSSWNRLPSAGISVPAFLSQ